MSRPHPFITALALLCLSGSAAAELLGSAFTYQGELRVSGAPANGEFDLQFELFDAESGGIPLGAVAVDDVPVANGVLSVPVDFGFLPFDGQARWLEIGVRDGASTGGFQGLAPRQSVTPAPYALHAVTAEMVATTPAHDHVGETWTANEPFEMLDVRNTNTEFGRALRGQAAGTVAAIYGINSPTDGTGAGVEGATNGTGPGLRAYSRLGAALDVRSFSSSNIIDAYTGANATSNLRFRVTSAGNVTADGSFTGGGADVAEFIDHHGELFPGDVIGIASDGRFELVYEAQSTKVAGVVTTAPGLLMNATDDRTTLDDGPALALAGRVPVNVTDEGGPIRPGDLLVSAPTPGHAMRAPDSPRAGTVIGKALGHLESGTGRVEILVMLR